MPHTPFYRWRYSTRALFSSCDQATYQQDLAIHRTWGTDYEETVAGLQIWHIFIGPNCRPDYGDLRFSDRYGRELAYYLWPDYDAESARVCVRLEGADQSGELVIWYGNPSATTTSDGDSVYIDFVDGSTTSGWTSAAGSLPTVTNGELRWTSPTQITYRTAQVNGCTTPVWVECRAKHQNCRRLGLSKNSPIVADSGNWISPHSQGQIFGAEYDNDNYKASTAPIENQYALYKILWTASDVYIYENGVQKLHKTSNIPNYLAEFTAYIYSGDSSPYLYLDWMIIRAYSATPPSFLRSTRGVNPSYAGLARLLLDDVIRFGGVGSVQVLDNEIYSVAGAGGFSIETSVRSSILVAGTGALSESLHLTPSAVGFGGAGAASSEPARLRTPIVAEGGVGSAYVAPAPIQFDVSKYKFESLIVSRSAQDALWTCDGKIDGLQAPLAYKAFDIKVPDHAGTLHTIFYGFVPGRDYVQAVAADKSIVQGYDAGFYLARQYLPDGDLSYPAAHNWPPMNLLKYWLGEETNQAGSRSRWEQVSGILPYRIHDPTTWGHPYTPKDWVFQPKTSKMQAIQEVCEYSGMVFLVKWRKIDGRIVPCAYFVHQDDIDDPDHGLDLPSMATFTAPDPCIADEIRVTLRSDEKYNRIIVRSSSPSGAWFEAIRETAALRYGDELPIEYLEERGDLPEDADHAGWCASRADELYAYYTAYAYTYTMTLIDRTDLELYQRCRFYGFGSIPDGETMRIVSIRYVVRPTHTNVEITITPDSRLSDLRRLQRSQAADGISEMQTIAQSQIDQVARGEAGTVVGIDGSEATVEMERGTNMTGRIV